MADNVYSQSLHAEKQSLQSWAHGGVLEGMYESGSASGNCDTLFKELQSMTQEEKFSALVKMKAENTVRRIQNFSLPEVGFIPSYGGPVITFPGCPEQTGK